MRPVQKWPCPRDGQGQPKRYNPSSSAKPELELNIGRYCSYCEERQASLDVEHVISQNQDSSMRFDWDNFLLGCSRCNGQDNKGHKPVDFSTTLFPHLDNTLLTIEYRRGGIVGVVSTIQDPVQEGKAWLLIKLVGLDKYPENPDYNGQLFPNDMRWDERKNYWDFVEGVLKDFESQEMNPSKIAEQASLIGHFSIWFTLFANHPEVRKALIEAFKGTASECFDPQNGYQPIPRVRTKD